AGGGTLADCSAAPDCTVTLQADCQPSGSCIQQRAGRNGGGGICYSNGVKFLPLAPMGGGGGFGGAGTQVLKADNTVCYTVTVQGGGRGGITSFTYNDAMGN